MGLAAALATIQSTKDLPVRKEVEVNHGTPKTPTKMEKASPEQRPPQPPPPTTPPPTLDTGKCYSVTCVLQRVKKAEMESGEIKGGMEGEGLLVYISFAKGGDTDWKKDDRTAMKKVADKLFGVKVMTGGKSVKTSGTNGKVIVIPSANLTCSLKGNALQYHKQVGKARSKELFEMLRDEVVKRGGYGGEFGATQRLNADSWDGPFMHILSF